MKHKEYTALVESSTPPLDRSVPLGSSFEDDRGSILNLIESAELNSVAIIHSKAGTERSNHFHKASDHYLYVMKGKMEYYERKPEEDSTGIVPILYEAGSMVYTPPGVVHLTRFLEDTVLISIGSRGRSHLLHEEDLVRERFFNEE